MSGFGLTGKVEVTAVGVGERMAVADDGSHSLTCCNHLKSLEHVTPALEVPNELGLELTGRSVAEAKVDPVGRPEAEPNNSFAVGAEGMTAVEVDHRFAAELPDIAVSAEQRIVVEVQCNRLEVWSSSCCRSRCKCQYKHRLYKLRIGIRLYFHNHSHNFHMPFRDSI